MNDIGKEYGTALFALALEENCKSLYAEGLEVISLGFKENPEFFQFLLSPNISLNERLETIEKVFGSKLPERVVSFLKLLCEKGRLSYFFQAKEAFDTLLSESEKIINVKVKSAVELSASQKKKLKEKLETEQKATVNIDFVIDTTILGGIVVETEDKVMDGSLQNRLLQIKEVISR